MSQHRTARYPVRWKVALAPFLAVACIGCTANVATGPSTESPGPLPAWHEQLLADSRAALLGQRDPNGPGCVSIEPAGSHQRRLDQKGMFVTAVVSQSPRIARVRHADGHTEDVLIEKIANLLPPPRKTDAKGGVGTRYAALWYDFRGRRRVLGDFQWHQTTCRKHLAALQRTHTDLAKRLGDAETDRSAEAARLVALAGLHAHVAALAGKALQALEYMAQTKPMYEAMDATYGDRYLPWQHNGRLPGGLVTLQLMDHLLEVERQSQSWFRTRGSWPDVPAALPPDVRETYAEFYDNLPAWRGVFDALTAPGPASHEVHSARIGLAAGLWRLQETKQVPLGIEVLRRASPSAALVGELLGTRSGAQFAGLETADRFHRPLWKASLRRGLEPAQALAAAHALAQTRRGQYQGFVLTIAEAWTSGQMDCIRVSDLMGAALHNSGYAGLVVIRECHGTIGHSVLGILDGDTVWVIDGLRGRDRPQRWEDRYQGSFNGTVELYRWGTDGWLLWRARGGGMEWTLEPAGLRTIQIRPALDERGFCPTDGRPDDASGNCRVGRTLRGCLEVLHIAGATHVQTFILRRASGYAGLASSCQGLGVARVDAGAVT